MNTEPLLAKSSSPLSDTAFDGGVTSAETLGRGGTFVSSRGTGASSSENPAALISDVPTSLFSTVYLGADSDVSESTVSQQSPLGAKTIQYLSVISEKGALFFEPLGRVDETQIINPLSPTTDFREVEFSGDAIGFAGASGMGRGSFGLSIAYLKSSLATTEHRTGLPDQSNLDDGNGTRLNLGFRYPTGPTRWGLTLINFPGFIWWKDYKRDTLPLRVIVGNTWRVRNGMTLSIDAEQRYYNEGSNKEDFLRFGYEVYPSENITLRTGLFSTNIENPDERHWTGGLTLRTQNGISITYAVESFEISEERVLKSYLSVVLPFTGEFEGER